MCCCCCRAVCVILAFVCHTYIIAIANWIGFLYGERNIGRKKTGTARVFAWIIFSGLLFLCCGCGVRIYCTDDFPGHFLFFFSLYNTQRYTAERRMGIFCRPFTLCKRVFVSFYFIIFSRSGQSPYTLRTHTKKRTGDINSLQQHHRPR